MKLKTNNIGSYIRNIRESKDMPLRRLAAALDIDTSTLAKIEKGQRTFSLDMAPVLAKELEIDFKDLQVSLLTNYIVQEIGTEEYLKEGLKMALKQI